MVVGKRSSLVIKVFMTKKKSLKPLKTGELIWHHQQHQQRVQEGNNLLLFKS
jgi:hypothetical protein